MNKNLLKLFLRLGLMLFAAADVSAFMDPCQLLNVSKDLAPISAQAVAEYKSKLARECELHKKYDELKNKVNEYSANLEQVSVYQALRYVDRSTYIWAAQTNTPVPVVFQVSKTESDKPVAERSQLVWRNWARGIKQVEPTREALAEGLQVDLPYLEKIHIGFYLVGDESSDLGAVGTPGTIKTFGVGVVSWPIATVEEMKRSKETADQINKNYFEMGLQPTASETGADEITNRVLDVHDMTLFPGNPQVNPVHLKNLTNFLNAMLNQARAGRPMIWKNRLMTPAELAYFIQQYLVQIHAFFDGNGRTSRFWQDVILSSFNLPAGSSGDLMWDDMLSVPGDYYQKALAKSFEQLAQVDHCVNEIYPTVATKGIFKKKKRPISEIDPAQLPYECRIIKAD